MQLANFSYSNLSVVSFIDSDLNEGAFAYLKKAERVAFKNTICNKLTLRSTVELQGISCQNQIKQGSKQ